MNAQRIRDLCRQIREARRLFYAQASTAEILDALDTAAGTAVLVITELADREREDTVPPAPEGKAG